MRTSSNKPLHTVSKDPFTLLNRIHFFLYSFALLALFYHHVASPSPSYLLIIADIILAFMWATTQACRWAPVDRQEFPDRLLQAITNENDLPALDIFICTADPWKEPPMTVVNTALSVMAYNYPTTKLSIYISDDGGSELTFFALMEGAKFARYWLPFCKEKQILQRAPQAYFDSNEDECDDTMKIMYNKMKERIESAMTKGYVSDDFLHADSEDYKVFKKWKDYTKRDHPSIIRVLVESSKDSDTKVNPMPNLIYLSREKRPTHQHHFKAGALNALLRLSNTMTNAPVILTLDCDMYSNDPQTPLRALCYILDPKIENKLSFVQIPQRFQGINKHDIYGGELKRLFTLNARGLDGLSGPNYVGTCCFFRRCSFYGPPPSLDSIFDSKHNTTNNINGSLRSESILNKAHEVTGCNFELGTKWGDTIGFQYGSLVEDYFTGYRLHCNGWISIFCNPERPAFLGETVKNLNDSLGQCKRWIVGLLEVTFSKYNPLTFGTRNASLLIGMGYSHEAYWGFWSIPVTVYAILPQIALAFDQPLFPKASDPWFYLYAYLFLTSYAQEVIEFLTTNGTFFTWWSDQRMWMIRSLTSYAFGTIQCVLNKTGLSAPGFSLTNKANEDGQNKRYDDGKFDVGVESPFFIPLGTVAILNLCSFAIGMIHVSRKEKKFGEMFVQLFISGFGIINCWPIIEAMFIRKDGGSMPRKISLISIFFAGLLYVTGYFALANSLIFKST